MESGPAAFDLGRLAEHQGKGRPAVVGRQLRKWHVALPARTQAATAGRELHVAGRAHTKRSPPFSSSYSMNSRHAPGSVTAATAKHRARSSLPHTTPTSASIGKATA